MINRPSVVWWSLALFCALIAPAFFYPVLLAKILCFALFACAFNLLAGFGGLLSFGHAAFFGLSAYVSGYIAREYAANVEISLVVGTLAGALTGFVVGGLAIRRKGIYFTMITMALAQMIYFFCLQAPFTGGEDGLQGVPRGRLFGVLDLTNNFVTYYCMLGIFALGYYFMHRVLQSPFGEIVIAIKENESRAISLGYNVNRFKLLVFVISAAVSGLAGASKTLVMGFATLSDVHWGMSGAVILMSLIGGMGALWGPILGAIAITLLENQLGELGTWLSRVTDISSFSILGESVTLVTGFVFAICVLSFREGLVGELRRLSGLISRLRRGTVAVAGRTQPVKT